MKEVNLLNFNCFFKNKILKTHFSIKKKDKIKEFNIYFKIANNNSVATISYNKNVIFWQTCKMFKGANFKKYSLISLSSLSNALIFFLNKIKKGMKVNLYFSGLNKFRRPIIKLFLKGNFFIKTIVDLKFLSHNGIRVRKKRRLAKRRMRKMYQYTEFKKFKKLKKENFEISYKSIDYFLLKEVFIRINFFIYLHFFKIKDTKNLSSFSSLRSVHNYGKARQSFLYRLYKKKLTFYVIKSWKVRLFILNFLKSSHLNKYESLLTIKNVRKSYKF